MRLAKPWPEGPLVFGHDQEIAEFVQRRIKGMQRPFGPCSAIGVIRNNKLVGGVVYTEYYPEYKTVTVSFAFDDPHWATREVLGSVCAFPFIQLDCNRANAMIARRNKRSRQFVEFLGFKLEGCARKGFGPEDAMIYGMLKKECRWIKEEIDGQEVPSASAAAA